jgi:CubicO group peptidase (beta-lactamase class C family)
LGHLEMLGEVSIQERRLFSEWLEDDRAEISLENMLHMTSGLDFSEVYAPGSDATAMLFTTHSASDVAMASGLSHDPGQHFYYSSGTTNLLARLINDRLGGTQAAVNYLADSFLRPLGLRRMLLEVDPSGIFVSSSYVYASARDWASLGQLMLNEGTWGAQRLLTEDWVSRAQTPNNSTNDPAYGYQFWLNRGGPQLRWPALPVDAYAMRGNREQTVMIVPSANVVIVRLGWTAGAYPTAQRFAAILGALNHG